MTNNGIGIQYCDPNQSVYLYGLTGKQVWWAANDKDIDGHPVRTTAIAVPRCSLGSFSLGKPEIPILAWAYKEARSRNAMVHAVAVWPELAQFGFLLVANDVTQQQAVEQIAVHL